MPHRCVPQWPSSNTPTRMKLHQQRHMMIFHPRTTSWIKYIPNWIGCGRHPHLNKCTWKYFIRVHSKNNILRYTGLPIRSLCLPFTEPWSECSHILLPDNCPPFAGVQKDVSNLTSATCQLCFLDKPTQFTFPLSGLRTRWKKKKKKKHVSIAK